MVALALPIVWAFSGLMGLAQLYRYSSSISLSVAMLDRYLAKKCVKLGINPKDFGVGLAEDEKERRRVELSLGINTDEDGQAIESRILVLQMEPHQVEGMPDLIGTWAFVGREFDDFVDGIRHRELELGIGEHAARLKGLIAGTDIQYEELSFLWNQFDYSFSRLKKLSDARLTDEVFRKAAGLPMFG